LVVGAGLGVHFCLIKARSVPTYPDLSHDIVTLAEAEKAAANWRALQIQIAQKSDTLNKEIAELKEHQERLQSTIKNYALQERNELFGDRKTTSFKGLKLSLRKAHDSIELKPGTSYEDVWKKVSSEKQIEKYPEFKSCIKPAELFKNRLKDLPEKLLNMLGLIRIKGSDEFSIDLLLD